MPIDPNIYAAGMRPVQQADSPMQTLAQISVIRNQQLQREEAQQRIAINQAAEDRLRQTAALGDQKRQTELQATSAVRQIMKDTLNEDGTFNYQAMQTAVVKAGYGDLWPKIYEDFGKVDKQAADIQKSHDDHQKSVADLVGDAAAAVVDLPPALKIAGFQTQVGRLVTANVLSEKQADSYINDFRDAPERMDSLLNTLMQGSQKQRELKNAEPKPQTVGPEQSLVQTNPDGTTKVLIQGHTKPPEAGTFGARLYEYAQANKILDANGNPAPLKIPGKVQDQLREDWAVHDPTAIAIRQLTLDNLKKQGHSPQEIAAFTHIVDLKEKSPLVKAADRTIILDNAAEKILANPTNGADQLQLAYAYIQAVDTYQSSVREGEIQALGALGTKWENLGVITKRYLPKELGGEGQVMPPNVATQLANTAKEISAVITKGRQKKMDEFRRQADTVGVLPMWDQYTATPAKTDGAGGGAGAVENWVIDPATGKLVRQK